MRTSYFGTGCRVGVHFFHPLIRNLWYLKTVLKRILGPEEREKKENEENA
jgi:hypothetical protein